MPAIRNRLEPPLHRLGAVEPAVVADQTDFAAAISGDQRDQERQEVHAAFGGGDGIDDLAGLNIAVSGADPVQR